MDAPCGKPEGGFGQGSCLGSGERSRLLEDADCNVQALGIIPDRDGGDAWDGGGHAKGP